MNLRIYLIIIIAVGLLLLLTDKSQSQISKVRRLLLALSIIASMVYLIFDFFWF